MNGEIFFNMVEQQHPISGSSTFLLKRWKKYTIYAKSGSYVRTVYSKSGSYGWDGKSNTAGSLRTNTPTRGTYIRENNPLNENLYQTNSIYLYDYVVVSDKFFYDNVYTASTIDNTPNLDGDPGNLAAYNYVSFNQWKHRIYTFKNSPDAITNNYVWRYNEKASDELNKIEPGRSAYGDNFVTPSGAGADYMKFMKTPIIRDDGTYFEIVNGYPRNHFTHKRDLFSLYSVKTYGNKTTIYDSFYVRNRQTIFSTVGLNGLEDGSSPVQTTWVGNLNLVQTDNVINH